MRVVLFTGKGGVGKTTLAAATAVALADAGRKTLCVSTDPAHSLADALDHTVGATPTEVRGALYAAQIDARALADAAWTRLRTHLSTILRGAGVDGVAAEELTVLPGVEDLLALSAVFDAADGDVFDTVIVDCGPTAETLRLLALPEAVAGYLERLYPTHRRVVRGMLAGLAGVRDPAPWDAAAEAIGTLAERLTVLRDRLTDGAVTTVRLVFTPDRVVAAETRRTLTALALRGLTVDGLIANRLVPPAGTARGGAAEWLRARRAEQDAVLAGFAGERVSLVTHTAAEPVGLSALRGVAREVYGGADPVGADVVGEPLLEVTGGGRTLDSEFRLRVALPLGDASVDLARIGDDLALTVDGQRRLLPLPSVLTRCVVTGARSATDGLTVLFRPDPGLWMRT